MEEYDCIVLYNDASVSTPEGCEEKIYPSTVIREEVGAVEESLREGGFNPYVLSVDSFSKDLVYSLIDLAPKFVFNLCEEINGKCELEMCVAGMLELMGIPYTGSDPFALGLALNKFHVKQILRSAGIPTARAFQSFPGRKLVIPRAMRFPMMVKPSRQDASLGINSRSVCHTVEQLERQVHYIHEIYEQEVLAVSEIDFSGLPEGEPRIVSYRAKWDEESPMFSSTIPICPASIPKRLENRIKQIAIRSYQCIGCRDYARVDMRTDSRGGINVLEVNPNPDISPKAGFARAARAAGYSYSEMILRITGAAVERGAKVAAAAYAF